MSATGPAPSSDRLVGTVLGRYLLVRRLGEGGMGAVYEATDQDLGRRVAIKTLHERYARSPDVHLRFLREGQAASRVRHSNVANIHDIGRGDTPYLVMEFLEGEDLARHLARERQLTVERAADLLLPVVAAVAAAHDLGVVHRDLKPENIFLSAERTSINPKVLDFGISKIADRPDTPALTGTGAFLGTPHYVSPEQARGARDIDSRSDQYSLGVILYQCTTGRRPVEEPSLYAMIQRIVEGDFPAPRSINPNLPSAFEGVILKAMARDPAQRFPTTRALGRALLDFASDAVRANYAAELWSDPESQTTVDSSAERAAAILAVRVEPLALGTTLGESTQQRDVPRRASPNWRGLGAGALTLAAIVGFLAWRASSSSVPQSSLSAKTSVAAAHVAEAPSAVPIPPQTPVPEPQVRRKLVSEPSGASVWKGGVEVGKTPLVLDVPADATLEVELRFPGYESDRRRISKADPEEVRMQLKLKRAQPPPVTATQAAVTHGALTQAVVPAERPNPYADQK